MPVTNKLKAHLRANRRQPEFVGFAIYSNACSLEKQDVGIGCVGVNKPLALEDNRHQRDRLVHICYHRLNRYVQEAGDFGLMDNFSLP
jgi:hypothetical protein